MAILSVFLRGDRVDILAPDAADPGFEETHVPWLLAPVLAPLEPDQDASIAWVWARAPDGPTEGALAFVGPDWARHRADLVGFLAPRADPALAREALALAVRYARDELGLEQLDVRVPEGDRATQDALAALGFAPSAALDPDRSMRTWSRREALTPR